MKKDVGIITFHNSYNCGSMMQTFALQEVLKYKFNKSCEIINFSNEGQQNLYSVLPKMDSLKNIIKYIILVPHAKKIKKNFESYENFKKENFNLSKNRYTSMEELSDEEYNAVIAGSDQIWNITIEDGDDAYFLPWVKQAKKIAYAPSFGARNIKKHTSRPEKYISYLESFDELSIRENNGQKWIYELTGKDVPVLIDPTLLLDRSAYDKIASGELTLPNKYIFYYSPGYRKDINKLVKNISEKYNLPVIAFNAKTFYTKGMNFTKFKLPEIENPATYLQLIKNAEIIITTSFHGSIFSTIYRKKFWTVKNGGMFGDDDRVQTLMKTLELEDRMISIEFDSNFDYMQEKNYLNYEELLEKEQIKAIEFLRCALEDY